MKKLAVIDLMFRWPPDGGARVDLEAVLSNLKNHYDVTLYVPKFQGRGEIQGELSFNIETIDFDKSTFNGPTLAKKFGERLKKVDPDLVFVADGFQLRPWLYDAVKEFPYFVRFYAYENLCNRDNGLFMRNLRSCYRTGLRAPIIDKIYCNLCSVLHLIRCARNGYRVMVPEFLGAEAWKLSQWKRVDNLLNNARNIVVYNGFLKEFLNKKGFSATVIPGGINPENFSQSFNSQKDDVLKIGFVGRSADVMKGTTTLVRALRILQEMGIKAELHMTGEHCPGFPVIPGVVYRGWVSREKIGEFYKSLDVIAVPSIWQEPFGIVTLEAMCCGCPVVASRVAGQREIIRHEENGLLAEPLSAEDFAEKIYQYWSQPEFTQRITETAQKEVVDKYSWKTIVERDYLPLLDSIVSNQNDPSMCNE